MKLILLLLVLLCGGCAGERAQQAANTRAGIEAAKASIRANEAAEKVLAILDGVNARIPATAEVPSVDFPAPAMSPAAIQADPETYAKSAPPEPSGKLAKTLAVLGASGLSLLWIAGRLAPGLPGVGPLVGKLADFGWNFLANRNQKAADKVASALAQGGEDVTLLVETVRGDARFAPYITPKVDAIVQAWAKA